MSTINGVRPDAETVAKRLLCLDVLQYRREAEDAFLRSEAEADLERIEDDAAALIDFLKESRLWDSLSDQEKILLTKPLGEWSDQQYVDVTWRVESLVIMAWSLQFIDRVPAFDEPATGEETMDALDIDNWREIVSNAKLRDLEEINRLRDLAEVWDWRGQMGLPPYDDPDDESAVREEAGLAVEDGLLRSLIEGDIPAKGKPYFRLSEEEFDELSSLALERHYALNWLCGYSDNWDNVPLDFD